MRDIATFMIYREDAHEAVVLGVKNAEREAM